MKFKAYLREDGKIAIRNKTLIICVDECCDGVAKQIAKKFDDVVVLTNSNTCMLGGNEEIFNQLIAVANNPNIAAVLVISMGCGSVRSDFLTKQINSKPCFGICIQELKGSKNAINFGILKVKEFQEYIQNLKKVEASIKELVVGVKCGGSDTISGLVSNPCAGEAIDLLVKFGATCIGGELFELIGCEEVLAKRAVNKEVARKIKSLIKNDELRWGYNEAVETMSIGNCIGGLSTIEEKSLGALHKMGNATIQDVLAINKDEVQMPTKKGFYLSEASMLCGSSGVNFAALGAHIILWTTGAAGFSNEIVPTIRISANTELFNDDLDIDARDVLDGSKSVKEIAREIIDKICDVANGEKTAIEDFASAAMNIYQKDQRVENFLNCK